jgi:hypothetical protein
MRQHRRTLHEISVWFYFKTGVGKVKEMSIMRSNMELLHQAHIPPDRQQLHGQVLSEEEFFNRIHYLISSNRKDAGLCFNPSCCSNPLLNAKEIAKSTTGCLYMQAAPSMPMTFPFTQSPSCDARKQTTRAMSMGWPTRLCGDQVQAYSSTWSSLSS